jgi:hypothetical protein
MMTQLPHPPGPPPDSLARPARTDRSPWNWLLLVPIVLPLLTVVYNRETPRLGGVPFFFWFQLMFTLLAAAVTALVFLLTRTGR